MTPHDPVGIRRLLRIRSVLDPIIACIAGLALSALLIEVSGSSPSAALSALWRGAFGTNRATTMTLVTAVPIALVALGWILAFSGGRISLGFEGQVAIGGLVSAACALGLEGVPRVLLLPICVIASVIGGALWASIAAFLLASRGASEVITTLMLNFVALSILAWVVRGPLQERRHLFPYSNPIPGNARWPRIIDGYPLGYDAVLVVLLAVGIHALLRRTTFGLTLRLTGANERAARQAGIPTSRLSLMGFVASGAIAGIAGSSMVLALTSFNLTDSFTGGVGFTGIVAALLARNLPLAALPAAVLLAGLTRGGALMETQIGVPASVVLVTQGVVIFFIAGATRFSNWTFRLPWRAKVDRALGDSTHRRTEELVP